MMKPHSCSLQGPGKNPDGCQNKPRWTFWNTGIQNIYIIFKMKNKSLVAILQTQSLPAVLRPTFSTLILLSKQSSHKLLQQLPAFRATFGFQTLRCALPSSLPR